MMPFLTLRLSARQRMRRLGKGAGVEEVFLAPFRGKDCRRKPLTPWRSCRLEILPPKPWGCKQFRSG